MNVSEPFIRRPIATSLLAAAVLLAGSAAYTRLPVAPLPRVDFPAINVSAGLPGASPETMAAAVATPLERRFGRIAGINELTSTSTLGNTSITLQFDLDRDVDAAARDVQAAINAAGGDLPSNLPSRPSYRKVNPADAPILILSLTSPTLPLAQVFDAANNILAQKISQVPGVGQVFVGGGQQPAVRVQVDPTALAGVGLGLEDVRSALAQASVDHPKGVLNGPQQAMVLSANDQLPEAAQYEDIILAWRADAPVRLRDVGRAFDERGERARGGVDERRALHLAHHPPRARRQHHRRDRAGEGAAAFAVALHLPSHRRQGGPGPQQIHPRLGRATWSSRWCSAWCWWCWWSSSSCAALVPRSSPASPCRCR